MYLHVGTYAPFMLLSLFTLVGVLKPFTGMYLELFASNIHPSLYLYGVWLLSDVAYNEDNSGNWWIMWIYVGISWTIH